MFKLVIADEEGTKTTVPLVRDEISIGRKEGNTIRLTERNISRTHAQLRRANGSFLLRDLGSYNGVLVNGRRVENELALNAGDQIKLGDYLMAVESDQPVVSDAPAPPRPPAPPPEESQPAPTASTAPVAKGSLVMLAGPTPGDEFVLPASGAAVIGRGAGLDVTIDHRSVSREHAELRIQPDGTRVADLDSANGLRVNGRKGTDQPLADGDVIELGQVALRYVAPGANYAFDPADAAPYTKGSGGARANVALLALGVIGLGLGAMLLFREGEAPTPTVTPLPPPPIATLARTEFEPAEVEDVPPTEPEPVDTFAAALAACHDAVAGERFAEAIAHATSALRQHPEDADAAGCLATANSGDQDAQTYVRGKAALQNGDPAAALAEFARFPKNSPYASKPEVAEAREQVAAAARAAAAAQAAAAPAAVPQPRSRPTPARAPAPAEARPAPALPTGQSPLQVASACLARGDNQCVIKALTGKARTAQELGLLIETHRSLGNSDKAQVGMEQYVKQFPTGPKASTYRRMLEHQGQ